MIHGKLMKLFLARGTCHLVETCAIYGLPACHTAHYRKCFNPVVRRFLPFFIACLASNPNSLTNPKHRELTSYILRSIRTNRDREFCQGRGHLTSNGNYCPIRQSSFVTYLHHVLARWCLLHRIGFSRGRKDIRRPEIAPVDVKTMCGG